MKNNITISYILAFAKNTWFWLGVWIFYYLRFTNYAGIGLIETVLIITMTIAEIPTGAVADLLGKKKTLIIAFLLEAVGAYMMAFTPNYTIMLWSVFVMCVGAAFYSGTIDALVFDSLKEEGKDEKFDKIISNISSISLFAPAVCSVIGGYVYGIDPRLPFFLNGVGYTIGLVAAFFLVEPHIDTVKFSITNYVDQTKKGFKELFKNVNVTRLTFVLLAIGFITVISSEMVDSFVSFEFGFTDKQLGVLWAVIFIISAFASQLTPSIKKWLGMNKSLFFVGLFMVVTLIISPYIGIVIGGLSLIFRSSFQGIFGNLSSAAINNNTESQFRATTLSTFNMIKNIPYVLAAYFIGSISDLLSAKMVSFYLGVVLAVLLCISLFRFKRDVTI